MSNDNNDETFGSWLRKRRRIVDMTQQALADCAGCSRMTIRKLESDERRPSVQLAELLADCLAIPAEQRSAFVAYARQPLVAVPAPPPLPTSQPPTLPASQPPNLQSPISQSPTPSVSPLPPPPPLRTPPPTNLPAPLTTLLGREEAITTAVDYITGGEVRLLTLTGPGGTGKTRLAIGIGRHLWKEQPEAFPDGIYFVDLSAVSEPQHVLPAIVEVLALKESGGQSVAALLTSFLQSRQLLLILDNFEQLLEGSDVVLEQLQAAAELRIIVTSRAVLHLYGEYELPVPPLSLPAVASEERPSQYIHYAAVALFVERSRAARPGFELTAENAATVVEICTRLDGLPLAIELAAARSRLLPPPALLAQLQRSLDLTSSQRFISERQRTLRGAIEWSYNLLDEPLQQLFTRLGVFAGEFTAEAANAVISLTGTRAAEQSGQFVSLQENGDLPILADLLALADQSMVQQLEPRPPDVLPRFRLLVTLREFALEQLEQRGELQAIQAAHAAYYLALVKAAGKLTGEEQVVWLERLEAAHDNLRAALAWGMGVDAAAAAETGWVGLQLVSQLANFWKIRRHLSEGRRWLAQALASFPNAPASLQADAHHAAGLLAYYHEDYPAAEQSLETSLTLHQTVGNQEPQIASAFRILGLAAWQQEQLSRARDFLEQALAIERSLGREYDAAIVGYNLGLIAWDQGDFQYATEQFQASMPQAREAGDRWTLYIILNALGAILGEQEQYREAERWLEESLAIARELGDLEGEAMTLGSLGDARLAEGRLEEARSCYEAVLGLPAESLRRNTIAFARFGLAMVALLANGDRGFLWEQLSYALTVWRDLGLKRMILSVFDAAALLFAQQRQADWAMLAVQLLGQAGVVREENKFLPRLPLFQRIYEESLRLVRANLDEQGIDQAWADGRASTLEEAVERLMVNGQWLTVNVAPQPVAQSPNTPVDQHTNLQSPLSPRYTAETLLATGGMGEIFLGRDSVTGETVVVKRLRSDLVANHPEAVERFIREGELLRQLNHPNIVKMLEAREEDGRQLIIMEYVSGGTLRDVIDGQAPLPAGRVVALGLEVADALARAHHLGILHRDLKPENVLLAADGTPRLTDFGLALRRHRDPRLTEPGVMVGTVAYTSPEVHLGKELDTAADIWSLGVILYELLSGKHPFERPTLSATLLAILNEPLPALTAAVQGKITVPLVALLERMLVKERRERLGSARQVAAELEKML